MDTQDNATSTLASMATNQHEWMRHRGQQAIHTTSRELR